MTPDQIKAMSNKPTPLPDVDDIRDKMRWDNCRVLRECIETLLATIPSDKSSAAYCYWLLAQGYRVCVKGWKPNEYLYLDHDDKRVYDQEGNRCDPSIYASGMGWTTYEEPPAVDDDELRRKCVAYSTHMLTTPPVPECPRFTPAELARLKELQ